MAVNTNDIRILPAVPADLPVLAELNCDAYLPEATHVFAFTDWPAKESMLTFYTGRLAERFKNSDSQVFKAVARDTAGKETIVGFVCWTLESGEHVVPIPAAPAPGPAAVQSDLPVEETETASAKPNPSTTALSQMSTEGINMEFAMGMGKIVNSLAKQMDGDPHYYISTFVVGPAYQRRGIGSKIIEHVLALADEAGLPTWLMAFPGSHDLYLRKGFEDVDYADVDLSEYDKGRKRGFGVYRSYVMVRSVSVKGVAEK